MPCDILFSWPSFRPFTRSTECDVRSTLAAIALCHLLGDMSVIDIDASISFIFACRRYDGAFGQAPGLESHAGSTFCCIAALSLCDRLSDLPEPLTTITWLSQRLVTWHSNDTESNVELDIAKTSPTTPAAEIIGCQGRLNKDADACYTFWVGAALHVRAIIRDTRCHPLIPSAQLLIPDLAPSMLMPAQTMLLGCQDDRIGGFGKTPLDLPGSLCFLPLRLISSPRLQICITRILPYRHWL